jgi:hypothetical protein
MVALFFVGYAFEIIGRRWTLFLSFFLSSLLYFLIPRTAPSYGKLLAVRCTIAITMAAPVAHPLIADYVHVRYRGKMIAYTGLGIVVGEVMAISIFKIQTTLKQDFYRSFDEVGIMTLVLSFYFLWAIKDPNLKKLQKKMVIKDKDGNPIGGKVSFKNKVMKFARMVKEDLLEKPILVTTIIGGSITRLIAVLFSTYLILWIQSFDGHKDGDISKDIYFNIMIIAVIFSAIILPVVGKYIDNSPAIKIVPWAFLGRSVCTVFFSWLTDPDSFISYFVCVLIIVSTIIENNLVDSIFAKNLSKATRGLLFGVQMFFCNVSILLFSLVGGWLFDHVGATGPFKLIGALDFIYAFLVFYLTWKYKWD